LNLKLRIHIIQIALMTRLDNNILKIGAQMLFRLANFIYQNTPFLGLRKLYFSIYARLVRGRQLVATVDGLRFDLELGELIDLALYLGKFEPSVVKAIEQYCQPGMIVFDIGANIGAHTLRLGSIIGEKGRVYAFEPTTFAFAKLKRNIELNLQLKVSIFRIALSDETQTKRTISFRSSWRTDGTRQDSTCDVDFVKLDDWAIINKVKHVDVIKIDIDGNEFGALAGGKNLLQRCKPTLLMEMVGPHFSDPTRNPFIFLEAMGYKFSNLDTGVSYSGADEMRSLIPDDDYGMTTSMNILAVA
jgi:FkbM family methyltransferase